MGLCIKILTKSVGKKINNTNKVVVIKEKPLVLGIIERIASWFISLVKIELNN